MISTVLIKNKALVMMVYTNGPVEMVSSPSRAGREGGGGYLKQVHFPEEYISACPRDYVRSYVNVFGPRKMILAGQ